MSNTDNIDNNSSYDPLNVAKGQGKTYAAGASGKFRKTPVTRIGFILLGLAFILSSIKFFLMILMPWKSTVLSIAGFIVVFLSFGLFFLGILFISNAFRK